MHIGHTGENAVRFLLGFSLLVLISLVNNTDSVFAYSLEVTTSGEVTMDIAPPISGDIGTAIVADNVGIVSDCRAGYIFVGWSFGEYGPGDYEIDNVLPIGSSVTVDREFMSKVPADGTITFYPALDYN